LQSISSEYIEERNSPELRQQAANVIKTYMNFDIGDSKPMRMIMDEVVRIVIQSIQSNDRNIREYTTQILSIIAARNEDSNVFETLENTMTRTTFDTCSLVIRNLCKENSTAAVRRVNSILRILDHAFSWNIMDINLMALDTLFDCLTFLHFCDCERDLLEKISTSLRRVVTLSVELDTKANDCHRMITGYTIHSSTRGYNTTNYLSVRKLATVTLEVPVDKKGIEEHAKDFVMVQCLDITRVCNRYALTSMSEYFKRFATKDTWWLIDIACSDITVFKLMIDLLHIGSISITVKQLTLLQQMSIQFESTVIEEYCNRLLCEAMTLNPDNFFTIWKYCNKPLEDRVPCVYTDLVTFVRQRPSIVVAWLRNLEVKGYKTSTGEEISKSIAFDIKLWMRKTLASIQMRLDFLEVKEEESHHEMETEPVQDFVNNSLSIQDLNIRNTMTKADVEIRNMEPIRQSLPNSSETVVALVAIRERLNQMETVCTSVADEMLENQQNLTDAFHVCTTSMNKSIGLVRKLETQVQELQKTI
jgi:hypothetical protein